MPKKSSVRDRRRAEAEREQKRDEAFSATIKKQTDQRQRVMEFSARRTGPREWKVTKLDGGQAGIQCPFCEGKATVNGKKWTMCDTDFQSRSCTYCSKIAFIPQKFIPKGDPRKGD